MISKTTVEKLLNEFLIKGSAEDEKQEFPFFHDLKVEAQKDYLEVSFCGRICIDIEIRHGFTLDCKGVDSVEHCLYAIRENLQNIWLNFDADKEFKRLYGSKGLKNCPVWLALMLKGYKDQLDEVFLRLYARISDYLDNPKIRKEA